MQKIVVFSQKIINLHAFLQNKSFHKLMINCKRHSGELAQLARVSRWHREGQGFESLILHSCSYYLLKLLVGYYAKKLVKNVHSTGIGQLSQCSVFPVSPRNLIASLANLLLKEKQLFVCSIVYTKQ